MKTAEQIRSEIKAKSELDHKTGCWNWTASIGSTGYGNFYYGIIGPKSHWKGGTAPKASYEAFKGKRPDGLVVRHICHNRACVNPDHLVAGTYKENAQDAIKAGRNSRGESRPAAKLTAKDIPIIKELLRIGIPQRIIGALYGVSQGPVHNIKHKGGWRHI